MVNLSLTKTIKLKYVVVYYLVLTVVIVQCLWQIRSIRRDRHSSNESFSPESEEIRKVKKVTTHQLFSYFLSERRLRPQVLARGGEAFAKVSEYVISNILNRDSIKNIWLYALSTQVTVPVALSRYYWTVDNANLLRFTRRSYHLD